MKKLSRHLVRMSFLLILLVLILAGVYSFGLYHFKTHFFAGSSINGIDVGEMTVDDAKYAIQNQIRHYTITCTERNGVTEQITGDQIYMQYVDDGSVEELLNSQNTSFWLFYLARGKEYRIKIGYNYDAAAVEEVMDNMAAFNSINSVAPTDAEIVDDGTQFVVAESTQGSQLNREKTRRAIITAIENGDTEMDFDALDLYEKPSSSAADEDLQTTVADMNKILNTTITYDMVDRQFTIDKNNIRDFILREGNDYVLSKEKIADFVSNMAYNTDTYGLKHKFITSSGREIVLDGGGDYGWCINQGETTNDLYNAIMSGESGTREPIYLYRAMDRSSNDIGGTYVEVCIEKQTMWCYKDGVMMVETPVVTGDHSKGLDTPNGKVWALDGREKDTTFPAAGNVAVAYWLPFFDSCGVHDSSWRGAGEYGGSTWLYNGSHGCVNTPKDAAGQIYEIMDVGYPVVVYYSDDRPVGDQPTGAITQG
ncbi:MAG: peptidoglycan binding domain-containing protein [Eubacteriales bacterium]|nr:peptidoglycan binding domain-containing protein [Eubacteriales bacterium]